MAAAKKNEKKPSFEESLQRLELIVRELEQGECPLSRSLELYTEGTEIVRHCSALLEEAEQAVSYLQKGENGAPVELPFETEEE